jgi:alcohol-forming fatty acyl-CoA reductase
VVGEKQGLVSERPFKLGETLRGGTQLEIDAELLLAKDYKRQLLVEENERKAMKELGLARCATEFCKLMMCDDELSSSSN